MTDVEHKAKNVAEALKYWMKQGAKKDVHFTSKQCTPEIDKQWVKEYAFEKLFSEEDKSLDALFDEMYNDVEEEVQQLTLESAEEERETERLIASHQPTLSN